MATASEGLRPQYAGFFRRAGAFIIDGLILALITEMIFYVSQPTLQFSQPITADNVDSIVSWLRGTTLIKLGIGLAVSLLYAATMEASSIQATLGKMALSIRVTDLSGTRISFARALTRNAAKFIVGIGFLLVPITARRQALHDLIAGSLVFGLTLSDQPMSAAQATAKPIAKWRKVLAAVLDFITIFIAGGFAVAYVFGDIKPEGGFELKGIPGLIWFVLIVGYFVVFTKFLGGTLWQRLLRAQIGNVLFCTSILISLGWLVFSVLVVMSLDKPPNYPWVIFLSATPAILVALFGWMLRYLLIGRKQRRTGLAT